MRSKQIFLVLLSIVLSSGFVCAQNIINTEGISLDYNNPAEYEIGGIVVEGTDFLDKSVLISTSDLVVGQVIDIPGDAINQAIENLWDLNLFSDVAIVATEKKGNTIFLKIMVEERPRLSKFRISGVKKGMADDIREKIKLMKGKIVTDNLIVSTRNKITDFFVDKGYLDAEVDIKEVKDTTALNDVILYINIRKNKKVRIRKINFSGNSNINKARLRRYMKDTKEYRWWNIFKQSKYIEENLEKDKQKIIEKYNARGYRDAAIVKDTVYKAGKGYVDLDIQINEGNKYYFRNLTWIGNAKYTSPELSSILGIKKGDIFNQSLLDQRLSGSQDGRDVSSLYMDDGYLFFQVVPTEVLVENDSIDIELHVYEGKQARINKVTVSGNTKTNDRVIMREIRTRPGQLFNRSDIMRTQRELAQLRYFDEQKLGVNPKPNPADGTVDIEYVVEEKPSDQVELSAGWGQRALIGTLGLSFNNFSARNLFNRDSWKPLPAGDGQSLTLRAQSTGRAFQNYTASFIEPWLGGKKPNSFSFSIYHTRQNPLGLGLSDPSLQLLTVTGVSTGLGRRLQVPDDYFQLYQEVAFQRYYLKNFNTGINFPVSNGVFLNFTYKINLSRSSVDAPIFPRSGSSVSTTLQITPPYSYFRKDEENGSSASYYNSESITPKFVEYYKWKVSTSFFTELADKLVLNFRAGLGILGSYNTKLGSVPFERFWLGGSGLVGFALDGREIIALRGFQNAGEATEPDNTKNPPRVIGGASIVKYVMELRYPISLNPSATIFALAFAEAGNSWMKVGKLNPFQVARCAGVGLRVFLPMFGLLGLDYGWGFDNPWGTPNNGNGKGHFQFTIGANVGDL